jgi:hypothetical protein
MTSVTTKLEGLQPETDTASYLFDNWFDPTPEFLIVDGAPGLERAIDTVWHGVPVRRCTVHKCGRAMLVTQDLMRTISAGRQSFPEAGSPPSFRRR